MRIVASNPDAIGDFVLRQPFYTALHQAGHTLFLIVRPHVLPLVKVIAPFASAMAFPVDPYQTDVDANWSVFQPMIQALDEFKPELLILAPYYWTSFEENLAAHFKSVPLAGMSGRHVGIAPPNGLRLEGGRTFEFMATVAEDLPELEKNQALVRAIIKNEIVLPDPAIALTPTAEALALEELKRQGLTAGGYCIACVGGTMNISIKTWPSEKWADVLSTWMNKHGTRLLFTGLIPETPAIDVTRNAMGGAKARTFQWIDETGTNIETLLGLIALSNGYIGHDTGPMHLAAALRKPVFALFGGGHWGRFLPAAPATRVLTVGVPCVGCGWNCPFEMAYCVKTISTADVLNALNDLTSSPEPRRDVRVLTESPETAAEMLNESAKLSARIAYELYIKNSTVAQRNAEIAVLKSMVKETASSAESNRMAAVARLEVMEALDVELKRVRKESDHRDVALSKQDSEIERLDAEVRKHRLDAAERNVEIACLNEKSAAQVKKITEHDQAYAQLMTDRNAWVDIYRKAEAKLKKIDDMYWYERIWDTTRRIGKYVVYGRQYIRKPEDLPLPTMTIVTPVFNCAEYIRDTIESVLSQNYPHLDYIVVDGGSTDGTLNILAEYAGHINRVISEPDNGMYDALGKGFAASGGEVLAYLNADDMYEPGALLRVGAHFRDHAKDKVIYHENTVAANGWRFANSAQPRVDMFDLLKGHILYQDGVFFRRKAYTAVGGVNRTLRRAGDYALWLEMSLWFRFHRMPGHVSSFRVRSGQISANMDAYEQEQDTARATFRQRLNAKRTLWRLPRHVLNALKNFSERCCGKREFFYPADFPNMPPPPGKEPDIRAAAPVCPLSGSSPDRLILSARHPMLGELDIQRIYMLDDTRIAINHPAPNTAQWATLRANRFAVPPVDWSKPPAGLIAPSAPYASPYAKAAMGGTRFEKLLRALATKFTRPNSEFPSAAAAVQGRALRDLTALFDPGDARVRVLDASCFDGGLLDAIATSTQWQRAGLELDPAMAAAARAKGHRIVECSADDAPYAFPVGERFHVVHLGSALPFLTNPVKTLNALKTLLTPGGVLTIGSPNLDSKQLQWFGPAWAHWHITRYHALYSRRAFERLAELSNMDIVRASSFSHAEWIAFGMHFQAHGLAWSVPHISNIPESALQHAGKLERLVKNAWDFRGRGDYLTAVLRAK